MHKLKYEQWKEMPDSKYGKGTVDTERKKAYNENSSLNGTKRFLETIHLKSLLIFRR